MIHPGDDIVGTNDGVIGHLDAALGQVVDGEFIDPAGD
jgi:hypothetical protein